MVLAVLLNARAPTSESAPSLKEELAHLPSATTEHLGPSLSVTDSSDGTACDHAVGSLMIICAFPSVQSIDQLQADNYCARSRKLQCGCPQDYCSLSQRLARKQELYSSHFDAIPAILVILLDIRRTLSFKTKSSSTRSDRGVTRLRAVLDCKSWGEAWPVALKTISH